MRKRVFTLVLPLLVILSVTAQAVESRVIQIRPVLHFDGTTAICSVSCRAENAKDEVEATLTLYQGDKYIDSWSSSGTGSVFISGNCKVESGKSYKLVLDYSINDVAQLSKTMTGTCP